MDVNVSVMIFVIPAIFTAVRRDFLRIDRLILTMTNPARGMMVIAIKANFQLMINNKDVNAKILIGSTNTRWKPVVSACRILPTSLTTIEVSSPLFC